jgi:hypothetical protein
VCEVNKLGVIGRPSLEHVDLTMLDSYSFPDGRGFPDSYREFIRHSGWARAYGLWLIYPPVMPGFDTCDSWQDRAQVLTGRFQDFYREGRRLGYDFLLEPDGDWSLALSLMVFGWSENGDYLLWETASRGVDGEFPVWVSARGQSMRRLGACLHRALEVLRTESVSLFGECADGIEPLPTPPRFVTRGRGC